MQVEVMLPAPQPPRYANIIMDVTRFSALLLNDSCFEDRRGGCAAGATQLDCRILFLNGANWFALSFWGVAPG